MTIMAAILIGVRKSKPQKKKTGGVLGVRVTGWHRE
jgi:hypothetical protein